MGEPRRHRSEPMSREPVVSVVVPVLDRPAFLRRALASLAAQTLDDFECIVVDDASTEPLEPVVQEFDARFIYVRRGENGGCTASRLTGYAKARGAFIANLDSDDELVPHALEHAVELLREDPDIDAAVGLTEIGGALPLRVRNGKHVVEPAEYSRRSPPPFDVVGVFRATVVHEWLAELPRFFKEEFALWLTLGTRHRVLFVDEPWGIHHSDAPDRLSRNFEDLRWLDDLRAFVAHFRPRLAAQPCIPLDVYLVHRRYLLTRHRYREEAGLVADWLKERRLSPLAQVRILLRTRYRDRRSYVV